MKRKNFLKWHSIGSKLLLLLALKLSHWSAAKGKWREIEAEAEIPFGKDSSLQSTWLGTWQARPDPIGLLAGPVENPLNLRTFAFKHSGYWLLPSGLQMAPVLSFGSSNGSEAERAGWKRVNSI